MKKKSDFDKELVKTQYLYFTDKANQIFSQTEAELNKEIDKAVVDWKKDRKKSIEKRDKNMEKEKSNNYIRIENDT